MPEGIVHIAGPEIQIGQQLRQRCAWCGAVLIDYDLTRVAMLCAGPGPDDRPGTWPVGALIEVDGNAAQVLDHVDGDPLPAHACGQIDHEVTGTDVKALITGVRGRMAELIREEFDRTAVVCDHTQMISFGALADAAMLAVDEDPVLEIRPYYPTQDSYNAACRALENHRARAGTYRDLAIEILGHFTETGHPGEPCRRTGWIREATITRWRAALSEGIQARETGRG